MSRFPDPPRRRPGPPSAGNSRNLNAVQLLRLAKAQKRALEILLASVLAAVAAVLLFVMMPAGGSPMLPFGVGAFAGLLQFLSVRTLSEHVFTQPGEAALMSGLALLPVLGILAIVATNATATSLLKQHDVQVAFMGPSDEAIKRLEEQAEAERTPEA